VLLLRPPGQSADLSFLLEEEGFEPLHLPLLEVDLPADPRAVRAAVEQVAHYEWVLPESPRVVRVLAELSRAEGNGGQVAQRRFLAPDEETARAIRRQGWPATAVLPDAGCGHHHLEGLNGLLTSDDRVLVLTAGAPDWERWGAPIAETRARATLVQACGGAGLWALPDGPVNLIVVHSPDAADALFAVAPALLEATPVVAAGPLTAEVLAGLGVAVGAVAARPGTDAVLEAAVRLLGA
jgi:uroporphyrinogen-III synthase